MKSALAISLVSYDHPEMLETCLSSLMSSDVAHTNPSLLYFDNGSKDQDRITSVLHRAMRGGPVYAHWEGRQAGIVSPRILLFRRAVSLGFKQLLEIHTDMIFPSQWFKPLADLVNKWTSLAMPTILSVGGLCKTQPTAAQIDHWSDEHRSPVVTEDPRHVLPWLIDLDGLGAEWYYDPAFHPMRCEDDDFYKRVVEAGPTYSTQESIVWHEGGGLRYRDGIAGGELNEQLFFRKHGRTIAEWKETLGPQPHIIVEPQ